eukprot:TRINITY_DN7823_c0_g1_i1.p1 TRINITY_DN7823_c0_g1~~TRINITY_DN7823_c0_g1_i1.p1  ORF type:complete len:323 (+),score=66.03 TRINITY_DN7823_c0_g1_i1:74-1042(+)
MRHRAILLALLLGGVILGGVYIYKLKELRLLTDSSLSRKEDPVFKHKLLIYNRIPKTGSTTLMQLPYTLCKTLDYSVLMVNISRSSHQLTLHDQMTLMSNITSWQDRLPALYHGHFSFLNFHRLGSPVSPLYINMIRRPLDRLISYYYFLRYGDNYRVNKIRSRMGDKVTFDECVARGLPDCEPKKLWVQVPWFCGHYKKCSDPGSRWALEQAKANVINAYFLVGLTEDLKGFIHVLENTLPQFFKGASSLYEASDSKKYVRKTRHKDPVSDSTLETLKNTKIWRMENEFYEFVASHYKAMQSELEAQKASGKYFHYQKVRP